MRATTVDPKKISVLEPEDRGQPAPPASKAPLPATDTNGFAADPVIAPDRTAESAPPIYLEDLADFDEFDFGSAAVGGKVRAAIAAAKADKDFVSDRPLNVRDLSRNQRNARFIEPRPLPLPLRARRPVWGAPVPRVVAPAAAVPPISAIGAAPAGLKKTDYIEARPLPLRPRRKRID
jgi:hypothetical protein